MSIVRILPLALLLVFTQAVRADNEATPTVPLFKIAVVGVGDDYITGGRNYQFNNNNGTLTATASPNLIDLRYESLDGNEWWSFDFEPKTGATLKSGKLYANAIRYPFNDDGNDNVKVNGISVDSTGRGCNEIKGQFKVRKIKFDKNTGKLTGLDLSFIQHCEGGPASAQGRIVLRDTSPVIHLN